MTLGERIRKRREVLDYTREDLANITGISRPQLSRYESDNNKPSSDMVIILAKGLGVTPNWLLGFEEVNAEDGLSKTEHKALALLRSQPPEKHEAMLELWRVAIGLL